MTHGLSRYLFACQISGAGSPPHTDGQMHTLTITLTVPGTTLMMHGAPALVLAQHLGRNLRFKGSPLCDRPRSNSCRQRNRCNARTCSAIAGTRSSGQKNKCPGALNLNGSPCG